MRPHPVAGVLFLALGLGFGAGAFLAPLQPFRGLFLPPEILVPFVLLQLATWSVLLSLFFLRPRGPARRTA